MSDQLHPAVAAAAEEAETKLAKLAPKIAKANPKPPGKTAASVKAASSAVVTMFKTLFLPMLVQILGATIAKYSADKAVEEYLIDGRNVLLKAYPLDRFPEE